MLFKLFKVPYTFKNKEGKSITRYNFYLCMENDTILRIDYNHGDKETDYRYDNYDKLCLVAQLVNEYGEIKFKD